MQQHEQQQTLIRAFRIYSYVCFALFAFTAILAAFATTGGPDREIFAGYTAFLLFLFASLPAHLLGILFLVILITRYSCLKQMFFTVCYFIGWVVLHIIVFLPMIKPFISDLSSDTAYSITHQAEKQLIEQVRFHKEIDAVKKLIADGVDVNARDREFQFTALIWAAHDAPLPIMQALLEAGADPNLSTDRQASFSPNNRVTASGMTALTRAVSVSDSELRRQRVQLLLGYAADAKAPGAILVACAWGDVDIMTLLMDNGADIHQQDVKQANCAHVAAEAGHWNVLQKLDEHAVDLDKPNKYTVTPLDIALQARQDNAVLFLLEKGYRTTRTHRLEDYLQQLSDQQLKQNIEQLLE